MTAPEQLAVQTVAEALDRLATDTAHSYRALACDLDRARHHAVAGGRDRAWRLADSLDRIYVLARALDLAWVLDCARVRALGRDLDRDLDRDCALYPALDYDLELARDNALARVGVLVDELESIATTAHARAAQLDRDTSTDPAGPTACRPAAQLSDAAVRLLAPEHRARFMEEFRAELNDLAVAGAGRRAQLGYALRLLARTGAHRRALRGPRRGWERAR